MTKSELITAISGRQPHLHVKDVELATNMIIEHLTLTLSQGHRIEICGFGGFTLLQREARMGRNPKTGEAVPVPNRFAIHFKPGLELRERVDSHREQFKITDG